MLHVSYQSLDESDRIGYDAPRKKQRLSSPTYEEQFEQLSQAEEDAFDVFNRRLSQTRASPPRLSQSLSQHIKRKRSYAIAEALGLTRDSVGGM